MKSFAVVIALLVLGRLVAVPCGASAFRELADRWSNEADPVKRDQLAVELDALVNFDNAGEVFARSLPAQRDVGFVRRALELWAAKDPRAVLRRLVSDPHANDDEFALPLRSGLTSDAPGIRLEIEAVKDENARKRLVAIAATTAQALGMPEIAAHWLTQLPAAERAQDALAWVARELGKRDLAQAAHWATRASSRPEHEALLGEVALGYAERYPALAVEFLQDVVDDAYRRQHLIADLMVRWCDRDRDEALKWVAGLKDGETRQHALGGALSRWSEYDAKSAFLWVARTFPGTVHKEGLRQAAAYLAAADLPDVFCAVVAQVASRDRLIAAFEELGRHWAERDAPAMRAWVESLDPGAFSPEVTATLHRLMERDARKPTEL